VPKAFQVKVVDSRDSSKVVMNYIEPLASNMTIA